MNRLFYFIFFLPLIQALTLNDAVADLSQLEFDRPKPAVGTPKPRAFVPQAAPSAPSKDDKNVKEEPSSRARLAEPAAKEEAKEPKKPIQTSSKDKEFTGREFRFDGPAA